MMGAVRFRGAAFNGGGDRELDGERIAELGERLDLGPFGAALVLAVVDVEVGSVSGWIDESDPLFGGRLRILFEAHRFDRYTDGRFRRSHPNLSSRRWNRALYWGGSAEYVRLERAMELDRDAALKSASYGFPQIMGDEHRRCGYFTPAEMISAFADSAMAQIEGMLDFMGSKRLLDHLRSFRIEDVSRGYNGRGFRANRHHIKLAAAIARRCGLGPWCALGGVGPDVRALQAALNARGAGLVADGAFGPATGQALVNYQRAHAAPHPLPLESARNY